MAVKIDKSNMRKIILDFPKQFRIGIKAAQNVFLQPGKLIRWPENIIICGMGGSALVGNILVSLRPLDVFCHKSYGLPPQAGNESLIICISYSGNTEETLSAFSEAYNRKLPLISITTGGKLAELSKKYALPLVKIPGPKIPPRLALGEMFAALIQLLVNQTILGPEISEEILKVGEKLKSKRLENQGKKIAKKIFQKIPIVYTSKQFQEIGLVWKNSLNETAKILAIANYFPELNHNEIVGLAKLPINEDKFSIIILRDRQEHPRILKRMKITKEIINKEGREVEFIDIKGKNVLEKIFSTILLGFWTSYWLALEYKIDPTPVEIIEEFKRKMKK